MDPRAAIMKAIVLAAGLGTRLGVLTNEIPKPLLDIGGRTILGHILSQLAAAGFVDVAINLPHHAQKIRDHVGDGRRFGLRVMYSTEEHLLGTAGGARKMLDLFEPALGPAPAPILVHYGDVVTDQDLGLLWQAHLHNHLHKDASATLLLHRRRGSNSVVEVDSSNRILSLEERPAKLRTEEHWVHSGISVVEAELLCSVPLGAAADLPKDVYIPALKRGSSLLGHPLEGNRIAVDSAERLAEARKQPWRSP